MKQTDRLIVLVIAASLAGIAALGAHFLPFPRGWLYHENPHYAANLFRAVTAFAGGCVIGLIAYTFTKSIRAERTVTGGHPRLLLYRHVAGVSVFHGVLVVSTLLFIRDRINQPLSGSSPVALIGYIGTVWALRQMLGYQNSRLRTFHSAKQVLATIEGEQDRMLCIRPIGSTEPMVLSRWLEEFATGEIVRLTVEKVEEVSSPPAAWRLRKGRRR